MTNWRNLSSAVVLRIATSSAFTANALLISSANFTAVSSSSGSPRETSASTSRVNSATEGSAIPCLLCGVNPRKSYTETATDESAKFESGTTREVGLLGACADDILVGLLHCCATLTVTVPGSSRAVQV